MGGEHDVVVIGGGHNGLVAACYLARAGLDVVVVEAADEIGGMTASGRPIPEAPDHVVNYCAADLLFWPCTPVAAELELNRYGLRTVRSDPAYAYLHPDGASLAIWQSPARTAEEIRRFSPDDAAAYLDYARFLDALADVVLPFMATHPLHPDPAAVWQLVRAALRHRARLRQLGAFAVSSGAAVIDEHFRHPVVQAALHCLAGLPIDADGSAMALVIPAFLHRGGAIRPVGGMQAIPDALASCIRAGGGTVLVSSPVAEILVEGGRAVGVMLADGRQLRSRRAVLATCDPRTTFVRLLPPGTLSPQLETRVRHIPANHHGAGLMKVDVALGGRVDLGRHHRWRGDGVDLRIPGCLIGTPEGIRRSYAASAAGIVPERDDLALWTVVTTAADPSQAPAGQDSMYVLTNAVPLHPDGGWKQHRSGAADAIVGRAAQFYEGVGELELGRWVETPEEMAERTGATNGCPIHVDLEMLRAGPLRPALGLGGTALPVGGLYLGGAGSHPGGGVTGLPGRVAAHEILRAQRRWRQ